MRLSTMIFCSALALPAFGCGSVDETSPDEPAATQQDALALRRTVTTVAVCSFPLIDKAVVVKHTVTDFDRDPFAPPPPSSFYTAIVYERVGGVVSEVARYQDVERTTLGTGKGFYSTETGRSDPRRNDFFFWYDNGVDCTSSQGEQWCTKKTDVELRVEGAILLNTNIIGTPHHCTIRN